jgi:hypothetical protein
MPKQILMPLNDIVFKNLLTSILCLIILYEMAHNLKEYFFLIWQINPAIQKNFVIAK